MSNTLHIQSFFDEQASYLSVVDEVLNEWNGEGCLQFPILMGTVSGKLSWVGTEGEKIARAKEPIIREFVRTHPVWYVTRGAHGGIMKRSEKQKKDAEKAAKDKAKAELTAAIEAEVARKKAAAVATPAGADTTTE